MAHAASMIARGTVFVICRQYTYGCHNIGWDRISQKEPEPVEDGTFAGYNCDLEDDEILGA